MAALTPPFVLFRDDPSGHELLFADPLEILAPRTPAEFFEALDAAENARRAGKWLAGYFSYEAGYLLEPKLRPLLPENRRAPLACLGVFDGPRIDELSTISPQRLPTVRSSNRVPTWSFADYEKRFQRVHCHLRAGDCYQANLTFPIHAQWTGEPLSAFDALTARQPVKYGALVSLGDPIVLSRSPELFFEIDSDGWIETHPMKGTAPRGKTPEEDRLLKEFLHNDPKNQAENRMIVDLLRNDISLISEVGTLDVPGAFPDRNLSDRPSDGEPGAREAAARPDDRTNLRRALSLRLDHRRPEDPGHGDSARTGNNAARCLLRSDRMDRARRYDALQRRHPYNLALCRR